MNPAGEATALELEPLSAANFPRGYALYRDYLAHFGVAVREPEMSDLLMSLLEESWFRFLLATAGPDSAGFCIVTRTWSPLSLCLAWNLTDLYLKPDLRGRGLGRALLRQLEAEALRHGIRKLYVNADRGSVGFYRSLEWLSFDYRYLYKEL